MDLEKIKQFNEDKQAAEAKRAAELAQKQQAEAIAQSVKSGAKVTTSAILSANKQTTEALGQALRQSGEKVLSAMQTSQTAIADALNNLVLATVISKDATVIDTAKNLAALLSEIANASAEFKGSKLNLLPVANEKLANSIDSLAGKIVETPDHDYTKDLEAIRKQIAALKLNVQPIVNVPESKLDITPVVDAVNQLKEVLSTQEQPEINFDLEPVIKGLAAVKSTIGSLSFPVPNYVLPFKNMASGKGAQANVDDDGAVLVRSSLQSQSIFERVSDTGGSSSALTTFGAVSGKKNYVRGYTITNTSSTNGYVDFRDDTSGAILWTVPIPANGGANIATDEPIFWTSAGTALAYDVSAALTTVYISVTGYQQ